jgi:hypothetical protein
VLGVRHDGASVPTVRDEPVRSKSATGRSLPFMRRGTFGRL